MNLPTTPLGKRGSFGAASITSKTSSVVTEEPRVEDLGDKELVVAVERLTTANRMLALENDVMQRYIVRMDPSIAPELQKLLEQAASAAAVQSRLHAVASIMLAPHSSTASLRERESSVASASAFSPSTSRQSASLNKFGGAASYADRKLRINIPQKAEMTLREIDELRRDLAKLQARCKNTRASVKAQLEETKLMLQEIVEAGQKLGRIAEQEVNRLTGRLPAERFIRYMEEWLRNAEFLIEKLRLRTSTLRTQNARAQQQLEQKEELGESLHPVDFEQLKIENKEFLERIEQKNYHLLELKKMTGQCALQLNNHKKSLAQQLSKLSELRASVGNYEAQLKALSLESDVVTEEMHNAELRYEAMRNLITSYMAPDVMEYVKKKAELNDLKKSVKVWTRRKKIQQTALSSCTAVLKKIPYRMSAIIDQQKFPSPVNEDQNSIDELPVTD